MAYLLVPPPSSVLPSAPLVSSQPVGTSVSVSLGSVGAMVGGGGVQKRRQFRLPMRHRGVVCLIRFRQAYILSN